MSRMSGITYGSINTLLFVIFGPLSTMVFMVNSLIQLRHPNPGKKLRTLNIVLRVVGLVFVLCIIVPVALALIFGKY